MPRTQRDKDHALYAAMRQFNLGFVDLVSNVFQDPANTEAAAFHAEVLANLPDIQLECLPTRTQDMPMADLDTEQAEMLGDARDWRVYWLKMMGTTIRRPWYKTPITSNIAHRHPEIINLMVSRLPPGTTLPLHRGPFKGVLRYHMGLYCPPGDIGIKVHGQTYHWKQGKGVVFDDTLWHTAWNHGTEDRVVLFADVLRERGMSGDMYRKAYALVQKLARSRAYQEMYRRARARP